MTDFLKISSPIAFLLGLTLLLGSGLSISAGHQGFALRIVTWAFWAFFMGLVFYLLELKNVKKD